ncbi:hypothetical protein Sjap_013060 [Stephania japonica]|uniref:Uncharacterized protein n=1 Tax=Stephania japonica TaxID=461633 RepID=A0AAP0NY97_9MAGN
MENITLSQGSRSLKLPHKPKLERPASQSYACLLDEIGKNKFDNEISIPLTSPHREEQIEYKTKKESELVKYMSNLPGYLQRVERGENLQEKALNFGVLDWGRLENWKHNQKHVHGKSPISLSSSSNLGMSSSKLETYGASSYSKGKVERGQPESTNMKERYCEYRLPDQHCAGKQKTIVLLLPKNIDENQVSGDSTQFECTRGNQRPLEANRQSFSGRSYANKEVQCTNVYSDTPPSCPPLHSFEDRQMSDTKSCSSTDPRTRNILLSASELKTSSGGISEESNSTSRTYNQVDQKTAASKGRCLSRHCPSTFTPDQIKRCLSSQELSAVRHLNTDFPVKPGPAELDVSCKDNSNRGKSKARRGSSSPLKRLLDPILKPRVVNHHRSMESMEDESTLVCDTWKSSEEVLECSKVTSVKRDLHFAGSKIRTDASCLAVKHQMVQALLTVTVKDGVQSLAFAVDNNENILTAKMKKTDISGKYDCSWVYTSYSFHKKKSGGIINRGGKGKHQDFAPKIVGQMKVSGSQGLESDEYDSKNSFILREFVLHAVEQKPTVKNIQDLELHDELAAIVVKVPKHISRNLSRERWCCTNVGSIPEMEFPECFLKERDSCNSREGLQYEPCIRSQSIYSAKVILPSGNHGFPSKGVPSSLINRWKSGGSCDCGGWDLGCNLRILACKDQDSKGFSSSNNVSSPDHFVLFFEGGTAQEKKPAFTFGTFNGGICTVNFSTSISSLQAFSICVALLQSTKLAELSEASSPIEDKVAKDFTNTIRSRIKAPSRIDGGAPSTHIPFPPSSLVDRV